jgi:carbon monoxide dehydrogenase subunit G
LQFESVFGSSAPAEDVYRAMLDVPSVARCLPGATIDGCDDRGRHRAAIAVKAGPVRLGYAGTVEITSQDDGVRAATMLADGREHRGLGAAAAHISLRVLPDGEGCTVRVAIDLAVAGRAAQLGQRILEPVAASMVERFAACLERRLTAERYGGTRHDLASEPGEVPAVSLVFKAMWTKIRHPHGDGGA